MGTDKQAMSDDSSSGRLWLSRVKGMFFGHPEPTLRDQIEDAIDDADDDGGPDEEGDLSSIEREMLRNLLHFGEQSVGDVAVPRSDIIAVPHTVNFAELVAAFAEAGHSRMPIYREKLDDIIGMAHVKDVFEILANGKKPPAGIAKLIRAPLYVPASMGVLDLLSQMRSNRIHLAIVTDEYGGTEGIVTIEDLVEEIVGDIEDEHDDAPEAMFHPLEGGVWDADARAELDDIARELDPRLAEVEEDVDTLGGLAFVLAGHVPQKGEILLHASGWRIEITAGDVRRATRVRLHPPVTETADAD
jgi:CBS domain containing-hemolysin-like protein